MADGRPAVGKPVELDLPKVLVGIPCGQMIYEEFAFSYPDALVGTDELFFAKIMRARGYITDEARNVIAQYALDHDFDYVFFMDSDMQFPRGTLAKMLRHRAQLDTEEPVIIGGLYNTRSDHRVNAYNWVPEQGAWASHNPELNQGLVKVDGIATGCMLLDTAVFEKVKFPWFSYQYWPGPKGHNERWSEDMVFAKLAMDAGIPVYADTDIVCLHVHNVWIRQVSKTEYQLESANGSVY